MCILLAKLCSDLKLLDCSYLLESSKGGSIETTDSQHRCRAPWLLVDSAGRYAIILGLTCGYYLVVRVKKLMPEILRYIINFKKETFIISRSWLSR